jgi:CheY-like chemotaxis protein
MALPQRPAKSVLVVDDDWQTRSALKMTLEAAGHAVREAATGQEALEVLSRSPRPDVILLDMVMPVMNGWEFRDRQLQDPLLADIPVVVFSAAYDSSPRAAEILGVARVLFKPIDCDEALASISDLFEAIEQR